MKEYIKPYLLRGLTPSRANQVVHRYNLHSNETWMYMTAIIDLYSRKILGWSISNSMTSQWCKQVLEDAIAIHGRPEIINSDQRCQYTSALWVQYLESQDIKISMDGKGRALITFGLKDMPNKRYQESMAKAA